MNDLVFHSLEITNFKSFLNTHEFQLDREPGLYYIAGVNKVDPGMGPNGVGKTGLWDALTWVCWNRTGRDKRPAGEVIPWTMEKGTTCVKLHFSRLKKKQTLIRTRRPNALVLAYKDKEREIEQHEVAVLLGMTEEMFRRTMVLGQFGSLFLDLLPEQQTSMFNDALDLDLWLRASAVASKDQKRLAADRNALDQELGKLDGRLLELQDGLKREREAAKAYDAKLDGQLGAIKAEADAKGTELKALLRQLAGAGHARKAGPSTPEAWATVLDGQKRLKTRLGRDMADASASKIALAREKAGLASQIEAYEQAIAGSGKCPECGQETPVAHLRAKLNALRTKAQAILERLDDDAKDIASIEEEIVEVDAWLTKASTLVKEVAALDGRHKEMFSEDNPHDKAVNALSKRLSEAKDEKTKADSLLEKAKRRIEICEYWVDAFKEIRLSLIDQALNELEMAVTGHAESLGLHDWTIRFQTERVTQAGNVSTAFNILLQPPDQDPVKFESYSGGESQRWQLAVAFGLSEVILARTGVNPNIEALDEPTRGLSPEGISDLLEHLSERAIELGRCIYVTEHHSLERGLFAGTIIVQKDKRGSTIIDRS